MKSLGIKTWWKYDKEISMWGDRIKCPVVGVLKDFNDRSFRIMLHHCLLPQYNLYSQAGIKLETKNISSTLQSIQAIWEQTLPNFIYEYKFLDDKIAGFYKQESQLRNCMKFLQQSPYSLAVLDYTV